MSRSVPTEFTLEAMKGGKRPPKPKKVKSKKKRKISPRHILGEGLAGQAMDALMKRKRKMEQEAR